MGMTLSSYTELLEFEETLEQEDLLDDDKYKFMLIKTIGTIEPQLKEEAESLLEEYYYKKRFVN